MAKPVTIGNEIWFSSIDNNAKTAFTMSEQIMQEAADKLDRSGINYYAFSVGEAARICVNSADTDKLLSVLGEKTAGLLKPQSLQKSYSPPEKNIIGNAEYRYIPQKTYHSTDTDIALRIAYELEKQNIQYSGNVYNSRKTTLTVSKPDHKKLLEIEKQILYARNTTFNELIEKRSLNHEEVHHSESEQQLQSSTSERENDEVSRIKRSGQIRSDETEIHDRGATGAAEKSSRIGATVPLSEPVREGDTVSDAYEDAGFKVGAGLVWKKDRLVLTRTDWKYIHEPIIWGWRKDGKHIWYGDQKQKTVFEFDRIKNSKEDGCGHMRPQDRTAGCPPMISVNWRI